MKTHAAIALVCAALFSLSPASKASPAGSPGVKVVTMTEAVERALQASPALKAKGERSLAADAVIRQAATSPNPLVSFEIENAAGTGRFTALDESEMSLGVSQRIELGGKQSARVGLAAADKAFLDVERERAAQAVAHQARVAFIELFAAKSALAIAEQQLKVAEDIERLAARRVSAARDPVTVKLRAQVSTADYRAKHEQLLHDLHRTKLALSNLWGDPSEDFEIDVAALQAEPVGYDAAPLAYSPEVREREVAAERAQRKLEMEQSNASSDVSVGVGVRRFENGGDFAGLLSLSVPIMVFDDNQGNVERAVAEYRAAKLDVLEAQRQHRQQLLSLEEEVERSRTELKSVRDVQLPLAREALAAARRGYEAGAFAFTEIAEAQRIVAELEDRQISALRTLHLAHASIGKLTGAAHETVSQQGLKP